MFKKKWLLALLLVVTAVFMVACGDSKENSGANASDSSKGSENGDKKKLRISLGLNDQTPLYKSSVKFKELVEAESDSLEVEVYHSGTIADDRSAIEMLQFGTLEITIPSTAPFTTFVPEYGVFDLPFTLTSNEMVDSVLQGEFGDKLAAKAESQGVLQLAWWENGFRQLTNSKTPVEKLEDVKGLKIRTMENEIHLAAWKALGANPTPMAFTELFTAMQQKTIDGQENPYPTIFLEKYPEVQKYLTETNHVYSPFIFLISKKTWDGLSEEQQEIVRKAAIEAGEHNRDLSRETAKSALEELKKQMTFSELSSEELAKFKKAVEPVIEKYKSTIGEEFVKEYLAEVDKAQ
ncbi:MAG: TRAP transporter substrate-binding protein [Kurthia sp.]|nr:TRAP transporter substrate-binding protein [Candidatus Kurthia equi]